MFNNHLNLVDPRDALDKAIEVFDLKAADIADLSGVSAQALSRYRRKHQDFQSITLQKIILALPTDARMYFLVLIGSKPEQ